MCNGSFVVRFVYCSTGMAAALNFDCINLNSLRVMTHRKRITVSDQVSIRIAVILFSKLRIALHLCMLYILSRPCYSDQENMCILLPSRKQRQRRTPYMRRCCQQPAWWRKKQGRGTEGPEKPKRYAGTAALCVLSCMTCCCSIKTTHFVGHNRTHNDPVCNKLCLMYVTTDVTCKGLWHRVT